ncbi:MAG: hypothetical protein RSG77_23170 [Hafnia sp.]
MMTRKSIDTVLLSVAADKLSQREWDWIKLMKPMDPPPLMVASAVVLAPLLSIVTTSDSPYLSNGFAEETQCSNSIPPTCTGL